MEDSMSRSTNPASYAALAGRTFLFRGLKEDEVRVLLGTEGVRVAHFEKGQTISDRDGAERALGVILFGKCAVTKENADAKMPMSELRPGELFGAASLFCREERYVARIAADASTWVLLIPEDALRSMMRREFRVAKNYMTYLTARIRFLSERLDGFLPQSVEERLYDYMRLRARDGVFEPEWSVSAIAEALRVGRTTLYRALDRLISDGKIKRCGRTFRLPEGER